MMNKTLVAVVISAAFSGSAFANCNNGASFNQNYRDCVNTKFEQVQGALDGMLTSVTYNSVENEKQDKEINGVKHRVDALEQGQKDLSTSINEVKGIATDALGAASNAQAQADANKRDIDQLNPKVDELVNISSKLAVTAASHDSRLSTVEGDIAKTNTRLDVTDKKVDGAMGTAQEALSTATNAQAQADANKQAITDTQVAVSGNTQAISKIETKLDWANKEIAETNANVNSVKETADRAESKADAAQSTADKAVTSAAVAQSTATRAEAKADMNTASIGKVNERVDQVEQDVSGIRHDVDTNTQAIYANSNAIKQHNENLKAHGDRLENHDKRIGSIEQQMTGFKSELADLQDEVKAVGALSMAAANLHYIGVESGYALSMGQYRSSTALAAGAQFNVNEKTAVTVQIATDFTGGTGGAVGVHGRW